MFNSIPSLTVSLTYRFQGIEGVVWNMKGRNVVRLNVDLIRQAVAVEVEREFLELVD